MGRIQAPGPLHRPRAEDQRAAGRAVQAHLVDLAPGVRLGQGDAPGRVAAGIGRLFPIELVAQRVVGEGRVAAHPGVAPEAQPGIGRRHLDGSGVVAPTDVATQAFSGWPPSWPVWFWRQRPVQTVGSGSQSKFP